MGTRRLKAAIGSGIAALRLRRRKPLRAEREQSPDRQGSALATTVTASGGQSETTKYSRPERTRLTFMMSMELRHPPRSPARPT